MSLFFILFVNPKSNLASARSRRAAGVRRISQRFDIVVRRLNALILSLNHARNVRRERHFQSFFVLIFRHVFAAFGFV